MTSRARKTNRRATTFSSLVTITELGEMIEHMRHGFPPKVLISHYDYPIKLLASYWRQIHGPVSTKGGIPGVPKLLYTRLGRQEASLFSALYIAESHLPLVWRDRSCLDAIYHAVQTMRAAGVDYPLVNGWSVARLLSTQQILLALCRQCRLLYVYSPTVVAQSRRNCVHCASIERGRLEGLVKAISARRSLSVGAINTTGGKVVPLCQPAETSVG